MGISFSWQRTRIWLLLIDVNNTILCGTGFHIIQCTHIAWDSRSSLWDSMCVELRVFLFTLIHFIWCDRNANIYKFVSALAASVALRIFIVVVASSASFAVAATAVVIFFAQRIHFLQKCNRVDARSSRNVCEYLYREQFLLSPAYSYSAFGVISFLLQRNRCPDTSNSDDDYSSHHTHAQPALYPVKLVVAQHDFVPNSDHFETSCDGFITTIISSCHCIVLFATCDKLTAFNVQ